MLKSVQDWFAGESPLATLLYVAFCAFFFHLFALALWAVFSGVQFLLGLL